uniref:Uncharacterized protein n=1 Tax=Picea glauca TaxID=3330 RepID=A0A117NGK5_PICGL|nr:hypothetical protein ABT39_MTgene6383 [Picea glauca]
MLIVLRRQTMMVQVLLLVKAAPSVLGGRRKSNSRLESA